MDRKSVGRSALWSIIEGGASQLLGLAVFLVTAHFVAPASFGVLATALLLINLFREIVLEGFAAAVYRQSSPKDEDYNACFFLIVVTSSIMALVTYLLTNQIAALFPMADLDKAIPPVCLLIVTFGLSRTHEVYLIRHFQFRSLAIRSMISIVIGGTIGIAMAVNGFGLWSLITQQIITSLTALMILWTSCPWRPSLRFSRQTVMGILGFSQHVSMVGVVNFINNQADIAFSSLYLGPANTGHYNAAKRIGSSLNLLIANSLNRVVMPTLASVKDDNARTKKVFLQAISLTTTLTAPVFAGAASLSSDIVYFAMGPNWGTTAVVISIIAVSYFLMTVNQYNQSIFFVHEKPHYQTIITSVNAALNIALFILVVRWGLVAIAAAYTVRAIVMSPFSVYPAIRMMQIRWMEYWRAFAPATVAAIAMGGSIWLLKTELGWLKPAVRLIICIPAGMLIYTGLLFAISRHSVIEFFSLTRQVLKRS